MKLNRLLALVCLTLTMFTSGCADLMIRASLTDHASYETIAAKAGSVPAGQARVWIYTAGGGPNPANLVGGIDFITFNDRIIRIGGNSYTYLDFVPGPYKVTTSEILGYFSGKLSPGKIQKDVTLEAGKEYFVHMVFKSKNNKPFDFVDASVAIPEMKPMTTFWAKTKVDGKLASK